jgi:tetraacyldisaccharide 4'-kinase
LGPFSLIYNTILSGRKFIIRHLKKPGRLPVRVISIGNLTLGGTGKTPAVIAVSREAKKRGLQPIILTRGYKGSAKGPCFVSKGEGPVLSVIEAGDEPYMMAERLKGTPIVLGKDRYRSGLFALEDLLSGNKSDQSKIIFILDDGFQHIALHRDTDVLLIDSSKPFWTEKLFPEGRLREPAREILRADIIVLTKADIVSSDSISECIENVKMHNPKALIYRASHKPVSLVKMSGEEEDLEGLKESKAYIFSGIANPSYFKALITSNGAEIINFMEFNDHHVYTQSDIDKINLAASGLRIITTEKDMVKLRQLKSTDDISALKIEFSVEEEFYDNLFKII